MMMRKHVVAAMLSAVAFAGVAHAQPTPAYLAAAGAGDMYETQSSKIVLQTTKNPKVRSFADMMIKDHAKSTAAVKAAAMKSGVTAKPPMLMAKQKDMIAQLSAAKGEARDAAYIDQQKAAHQEALATHKDYAASGDKAPLRAAAAKIVPVVEQHITMLGAM